MEKISKILKITYIIAGAQFAAAILGLVRDRLLASTFGAGNTLDAYYASFRVPDFVFNVLILGAIFAAFIPVFTDLRVKEDHRSSWRLANSILNIFILATIIICGLLIIFADPVMKLLVPGFDKETFNQTVLLTRIMLISPMFFGIASIFGSILNSFKRFLAFALTPIFYNLSILLGIIFLEPKMGVMGPTIGAVFGAFLQAAFLIIPVMRVGFSWKLILEFSSSIRQIGKLMVPRMASLGILQINLLAETMIASTLAVGSIAVLRFATNIQTLPASMLGIAFATALFPTLAEKNSKQETGEFKSNIVYSFRQIMFFVVPATAAIILLRAQIVRLLLGAGNFSWSDTALTAACLGFFAISLFAQSLSPILLRAFFALKDTKTPLWISIASLVIYIASALMLVNVMGVLGLALAFSISAVVQAGLLMAGVRHKIGAFGERQIIKQTAKFIIASFIMGLGIYATLYGVANFVNTNTYIGLAIQFVSAVCIGILLYLISVKIMRVEELKYFRDSFRKTVLTEKD